jgi:hypothetical protein
MIKRFCLVTAIFAAALAFACSPLTMGDVPPIGAGSAADGGKTVDVEHTAVEKQSIGNCWIYSMASWAESMHTTRTGNAVDISQSYWTYMHWFDQVTGYYFSGTELATGGTYGAAKSIIEKYGLMFEGDFVPEDSAGEMSQRQANALAAINRALASGGSLSTQSARADRALVRRVFDDAWGLSAAVKGALDGAFGSGMGYTFRNGASSVGTAIVNPRDFAVRYAYATGGNVSYKDATLATALTEWKTASYGGNDRATMKRVIAALNARQPVFITWLVDFNAMEDGAAFPEKKGSFNLDTLKRKGMGRQGGHMTVLEDYEAEVTVTVSAGGSAEPVVKRASGSVEKAGWRYYVVKGLSGSVKVTLSGTGSPDVFIRNGRRADLANRVWDARLYTQYDNTEATIQAGGDLYVTVYGWEASTFDVEFVAQGATGGTTTRRVRLKAGVTLDPGVPEDMAQLQAALRDDATIVFLRTKNSWGTTATLPQAPFVDGGYHDLYMDYLEGPIQYKGSGQTASPTRPLQYFILPPGF